MPTDLVRVTPLQAPADEIEQGRLRVELRNLRRRGARNAAGEELNQGRSCARCKTSLGRIYNTGASCSRCRHRVCRQCREYRGSNGTDWLCVVCHKITEIQAVSGEWMNEAAGVKRASRRTFLASPADILKRSIRRSWTINEPPASWCAVRGSPELRAYQSLPRHQDYVEVSCADLIVRTRAQRQDGICSTVIDEGTTVKNGKERNVGFVARREQTADHIKHGTSSDRKNTYEVANGERSATKHHEGENRGSIKEQKTSSWESSRSHSRQDDSEKIPSNPPRSLSNFEPESTEREVEIGKCESEHITSSACEVVPIHEQDQVTPRISQIKPPRIHAKLSNLPDGKQTLIRSNERKSNIPILRRSSREFEDIRSPLESTKRSLIPPRYRGSTDDLRRSREDITVPSLIPKLFSPRNKDEKLKRQDSKDEIRYGLKLGWKKDSKEVKEVKEEIKSGIKVGSTSKKEEDRPATHGINREDCKFGILRRDNKELSDSNLKENASRTRTIIREEKREHDDEGSVQGLETPKFCQVEQVKHGQKYPTKDDDEDNKTYRNNLHVIAKRVSSVPNENPKRIDEMTEINQPAKVQDKGNESLKNERKFEGFTWEKLRRRNSNGNNRKTSNNLDDQENENHDKKAASGREKILEATEELTLSIDFEKSSTNDNEPVAKDLKFIRPKDAIDIDEAYTKQKENSESVDSSYSKRGDDFAVVRREFSKEEFSNPDDTDDIPNRRCSSHLSPEASPLSTRSSRYSPRESESEPTPALPRKTGESSSASQRIREAITRTRRESNSSAKYESSGSESIRLSESGLRGHIDTRRVRFGSGGAGIEEVYRDSATSAGEDEPRNNSHNNGGLRDSRLAQSALQGRAVRRRRQFDNQGSRRRGRSHVRGCVDDLQTLQIIGRGTHGGSVDQRSPPQGQQGQDTPIIDYRRLVFISSDSSSGREEDDADTSSGSSSLNGPSCSGLAHCLDDCDWDYFEGGGSIPPLASLVGLTATSTPNHTSIRTGRSVETESSRSHPGISLSSQNWSCCPGRGSSSCQACGGARGANVFPVPVPIPVPVPYPVPVPASLWTSSLAHPSMINCNSAELGALQLSRSGTSPLHQAAAQWFAWPPRFSQDARNALRTDRPNLFDPKADAREAAAAASFAFHTGVTSERPSVLNFDHLNLDAGAATTEPRVSADVSTPAKETSTVAATATNRAHTRASTGDRYDFLTGNVVSIRESGPLLVSPEDCSSNSHPDAGKLPRGKEVEESSEDQENEEDSSEDDDETGLSPLSGSNSHKKISKMYRLSQGNSGSSSGRSSADSSDLEDSASHHFSRVFVVNDDSSTSDNDPDDAEDIEDSDSNREVGITLRRVTALPEDGPVVLRHVRFLDEDSGPVESRNKSESGTSDSEYDGMETLASENYTDIAHMNASKGAKNKMSRTRDEACKLRYLRNFDADANEIYLVDSKEDSDQRVELKSIKSLDPDVVEPPRTRIPEDNESSTDSNYPTNRETIPATITSLADDEIEDSTRIVDGDWIAKGSDDCNADINCYATLPEPDSLMPEATDSCTIVPDSLEIHDLFATTFRSKSHSHGSETSLPTVSCGNESDSKLTIEGPVDNAIYELTENESNPPVPNNNKARVTLADKPELLSLVDDETTATSRVLTSSAMTENLKSTSSDTSAMNLSASSDPSTPGSSGTNTGSEVSSDELHEYDISAWSREAEEQLDAYTDDIAKNYDNEAFQAINNELISVQHSLARNARSIADPISEETSLAEDEDHAIGPSGFVSDAFSSTDEGSSSRLDCGVATGIEDTNGIGLGENAGVVSSERVANERSIDVVRVSGGSDDAAVSDQRVAERTNEPDGSYEATGNNDKPYQIENSVERIQPIGRVVDPIHDSRASTVQHDSVTVSPGPSINDVESNVVVNNHVGEATNDEHNSSKEDDTEGKTPHDRRDVDDIISVKIHEIFKSVEQRDIFGDNVTVGPANEANDAKDTETRSDKIDEIRENENRTVDVIAASLARDESGVVARGERPESKQVEGGDTNEELERESTAQVWSVQRRPPTAKDGYAAGGVGPLKSHPVKSPQNFPGNRYKSLVMITQGTYQPVNVVTSDTTTLLQPEESPPRGLAGYYHLALETTTDLPHRNGPAGYRRPLTVTRSPVQSRVVAVEQEVDSGLSVGSASESDDVQSVKSASKVTNNPLASNLDHGVFSNYSQNSVGESVGVGVGSAISGVGGVGGAGGAGGTGDDSGGGSISSLGLDSLNESVKSSASLTTDTTPRNRGTISAQPTPISAGSPTQATSGTVILEEGLADDDSWVEEVSHDEDEQGATTATEESSEDETNNLGDREEELRGYHRQAIDFTLHTIVEESCEESEAEPASLATGSPRKQRPPSASELEKYFFFGLGEGSGGLGGVSREIDSLSETSSIYSEGLESLGQDEPCQGGDKNSPDYLSPSSRLEKYFLSDFLGIDQDGRDSDGSVGSDSEGTPSPEQRRKRLVRARGTGRSSTSTSLDNLLALTQSSQNLSSQNSLQDLTMNPDSQETQSEGSSTETDGADDQTAAFGTDGQFDTVKRKKKKPRNLGTQSPRISDDRNKTPEPPSAHDADGELLDAVNSDDDRAKTPQPENVVQTVGKQLSLQARELSHAGRGKQQQLESGRGGNSGGSSITTGNASGSPANDLNPSRAKQHSRDSGFIGSCDDLLQHQRVSSSGESQSSNANQDPAKKDSTHDRRTSDEHDETSISSKSETPLSQSSLAPPNVSLSRKDSFNNWSSDEETNLMMSKMRQFFKTMVANTNNAQPSVNPSLASPAPSPRLSGSSPKCRVGIQNRTKPPQLVYFETELTRLMKTVPGIRDDQVREIVEYLSSEDTWSDSYDSSDYTSSDLEGAGGRRSALQEQISQSCQQIISKFDTTAAADAVLSEKETVSAPSAQPLNCRDTAFVYQKLVQSFTKMTGDGVSSDASSTPHSSPPLIAKVMHHIGSRLVALMHEVSEGGPAVQPSSWRRYPHHRTPSSASTTTEDDDSTSDSANTPAQLPRSKSHDPLLLLNGHPTAGYQEGEEREASDYERFSWRGSFESALMAADSRTKLSLLACSGDTGSASALAMAAKRRSAGDLLFNPKSLSREQLDRVRSCGSIGGGSVSIEDKIWSNRRRSSVPDANTRGESGASAGDDDTEDDLYYNGDSRATTLPRGLQAASTATNSLPRLPAVAPTSGSSTMHKAHSVHHFLQQHNNVKSARYRPPGFARNNLTSAAAGGPKRAVSAPGLQLSASNSANKRETARSRRQAVSLTPDDGSSLSEACSTPIIGGVRGGNFSPDDDIDRALHSSLLGNRISSSSLGARSDSMASVYSGAGEGRWCGSVAVRGEVEFALQYDYKQKTFEVRVTQCRDLAPVDVKRNRSDPYVKVYLLPDKSKGGKRKTKVKKHTLNPVFDETLKFHMNLNGLETRTLWLTVWHSDMFGRNDFLGEVRMALENKIFDDPTPKWYPLQERSELFDDPVAYKGEVIVGLKFVPPDLSQQQERGGERGSGDRGSAKTRKSWNKGALHVLVKEARNLQTRAKHSGTCDPFCKSYLLPDKGRSGKQKTGVVRRCTGGSPVWGHTFVYRDVSLQELADRGLELTVWDHDRIASNEFLGGVRFNLGTGKHYGKAVEWMDATGRELSLWQNMLERPNFWVEGAVTLRPNLHNHNRNNMT